MTENFSSNGDFAAMLDSSMQAMERLEPGQKIDARIVNVTPEWIFLDIGRKGEGVLDKKELLNADGECTAKVGDSVAVFFLRAKGGEMLFTTRLGRGENSNAQLEDAFHNGIPVDALVEKEIKGGFEVKIGTARAFCPYSQMSLRRVEDNSIYIGERFTFYIAEYSEKGRNIVVSRRQILLEEEEAAKEALKERLTVGMVVKGTITNIRNFGAFCDIGGLEGLIPISEISYDHIKDPNDVLEIGQEVEVEIGRLNWAENRHSFSMKRLQRDPWSDVPERFPVGTVLMGTVMRLKPFGAFVSIDKGIDGLLHVSKIASPTRIQYPAQVLKVGQEIEVEVESIDVERKRISLSQPQANKGLTREEEEVNWAQDYKKSQKTSGSGMGSLGSILQGALDKKNK